MDHVRKALHAHVQAFSNVLGDEQLAIAKTVVQEDNESTAETGRVLHQATMKKAVSAVFKSGCVMRLVIVVLLSYHNSHN